MAGPVWGVDAEMGGLVGGLESRRRLSDQFSAHEARQVHYSAMRPAAAGTPSVMGIDEGGAWWLDCEGQV